MLKCNFSVIIFECLDELIILNFDPPGRSGLPTTGLGLLDLLSAPSLALP
ncbi:MAG: hypothetical protein ACRD6U_07465 [Nitrososphaeraceae archaeon]